jgi:biopolymer transport protein ExbB/biopolymer transport protein TolQ
MEMGPLELWNHMGLIGRIVFIILVILSVVSLTIAVERGLVFRAAKRQSLKFAQLATMYLKKDQPEAVIEASKKFKHSHLAKVVSAGLMEFQFESESSLSGPDVIEAARRAIERSMFTTTADFKRGIGLLATIATSAPFIGLFGTVVGIINAFQGMAVTGSGGIGAVSAGISEALVTTAVSLFVAVPAVWMFNIFTNKIERFQMEMTNAASELIDFFIKKHGGSHAIGVAHHR